MTRDLPKIKSKKKNVTLERLSGVPFDNARSLKKAQKEVRLKIWRRLEEAKALESFVNQSDYDFWHRELRAGIVVKCEEANLVHVYSEGNGIQVSVHRSLTDPASEPVLRALVKSVCETFSNSLYKLKGFVAKEQEPEYEVTAPELDEESPS